MWNPPCLHRQPTAPTRRHVYLDVPPNPFFCSGYTLVRLHELPLSGSLVRLTSLAWNVSLFRPSSLSLFPVSEEIPLLCGPKAKCCGLTDSPPNTRISFQSRVPPRMRAAFGPEYFLFFFFPAPFPTPSFGFVSKGSLHVCEKPLADL